MRPISIPEFLQAFSEEWSAQLSEHRDCLLHAYSQRTTWTSYMLREDGVLHKVMLRLLSNRGCPETSLRYSREWYTIDAVYVGGDDLYKDGRRYPSYMSALIEHEQGGALEEEMWKLIFWRSPLKILVAYDYWESKKQSNKEYEVWMKCKLGKLVDMLRLANEAFPENQETEYLFLIANRQDEEADPQWRWASASVPELSPLP
ncbi:MAG: hypothetical protein O3B01_31875 [Planctomycetota bacterium]|nr:hypothetical protein [Planctomycetota bacterium]MDA1143182.1 hypothetical protein [Planctomycetota bacterium]